MTVSLESIPIELTEHIVTFLNLRDIASLRLTNRSIESKASQGHFTKFFTRKQVKLDTETLQNMLHVTRRGRLGCLLRHCIISGITEPDTASKSQIAGHKGLLAQAFDFLKQRSSRGSLDSLRLRVTIRTGRANGGAREAETIPLGVAIWMAALNTFNITMAALSKSELLVYEQLDIYGTISSCSLNYDAFLSLSQQISFLSIFYRLKKLMLSLSSPYDASTEHTPTQETTAISLSQTAHVVYMPNLEALHMHWYSLRSDAPATSVQPAPGIDNAIVPAIAHLKECSVRGVYTTKGDLLRFIKAVNPSVLIMADVSLTSGTYTSIFDHLTNPETSITHYFLDDIREGTNLVHFDTEGTSKFPYKGIEMGHSWLTRDTTHFKEPIRYSITSRRPIRSGERKRWLKYKLQEFGPSENLVRDFIELNGLDPDFP
ncbi:hypothetical protein GGR58DRAFT_522184 [Xylaria digitata]|nr:hypothetical protein GGR58DRAFT_522184 [Xylaria digitata]